MMHAPEKIKELLQEKDFIAKVISVFVAVLLWAYISNSSSGEVRFKIPLEFINLSPKHTISYVSDNNAIAVLTGKNEYLKNIRKKDIRAVVNLESPKIGRVNKYKIELLDNEIPVNIDVSFAEPAVKIKVENIAVKQALIIPRITGSPGKGFLIGKYIVKPETFKISGAKSIVDKISYVHTKEIDISNKHEDLTITADLDISSLVSVEYKNIPVEVNIPFIRYSDLLNIQVPLLLTNMEPDYRYSFKDTYIRVYYKSGEQQRIFEDDIGVFVNIDRDAVRKLMKEAGDGKIETEFPVKAMVRNDKKINVIALEPEKAVIKIEKK